MQRSSFVFLTVIGSAFLFAACGGGSGRNLGGGGLYCNANQAEAFVIPTTAQKISFSPEEDGPQIPAGTYVYDRADFLYVNKADLSSTRNWLIIQTTENNYALQENKTPTSGPYCVRGLLPSTPDFSKSAEGVSQMTVSEDGSISYQFKQYTLTWNSMEQKLSTGTSVLGEDSQDPLTVYSGKVTDLSFYKIQANNDNDKSYEILSEWTDPKTNEAIYLKVRMILQSTVE